MKRIAALALVGTLVLLVGVWCYFGHDDDPFTAKYRLIREGTTYEQAVTLLGPAKGQFHPGGSCGDHIYHWKSLDDGRSIAVTWNVAADLSQKSLLAKDHGSILSEQHDERYATPWWERFMTSVGLR